MTYQINKDKPEITPSNISQLVGVKPFSNGIEVFFFSFGTNGEKGRIKIILSLQNDDEEDDEDEVTPPPPKKKPLLADCLLHAAPRQEEQKRE